MKKLILTIFLAISAVDIFAAAGRPPAGGGFNPFTRGGSPIGGGGSSSSSGGAPGTTVVPVGTDLSTLSVQSDTAYLLGEGSYFVGTPSIIMSNYLVGTPYTGWLLGNKTNITIQGVRGQTKIYATNGLGEGMFISNCSGIKLIDVDYIAYTNNNYTQLPGYSPVTTNQGGSFLWANIAYYSSENLLFSGLYMFGGCDHGIADNAYINGTLFPNGNIKSTNNIVFEDCTFINQGGFRTNSASGGATTFAQDGASIISTSARIRRCHFESSLRGIELYDEADSGGGVFTEIEITDCSFKNMASFGVGFAGSTNGHYGTIANFKFNNDQSFNYHGTNFGGSGQVQFQSYECYGLQLNGGRGWRIVNPDISGRMSAGISVGNGNSFCDDFIFDNIFLHDISDGADTATGLGFRLGIASDTAANASAVRRARITNLKMKNINANGLYIIGTRDCEIDGVNMVDAGLYSTASSEDFASIRIGVSSYTANTTTNLVLRNVTGQGVSAWGIAIGANVYNSVVENWRLTGYGENGGITNKNGWNTTTLGIPRGFSGAIDFPSVAAGSTYTTNWAATGVTTNDHVEVQVPAQFYASGNVTNALLNFWTSNAFIYARLVNNDLITAADAPSVRFPAIVRQVRIHGQ